MKSAKIHLPYFKQGDDLAHFLKDEPPKVALLLHAKMLQMASAQLRQISEVIGDVPVEIDACTHHIGILGPDGVIAELVRLDLASEEPDDGEPDDGEPDGDEPDDGEPDGDDHGSDSDE